MEAPLSMDSLAKPSGDLWESELLLGVKGLDKARAQ